MHISIQLGMKKVFLSSFAHAYECDYLSPCKVNYLQLKYRKRYNVCIILQVGGSTGRHIHGHAHDSVSWPFEVDQHNPCQNKEDKLILTEQYVHREWMTSYLQAEKFNRTYHLNLLAVQICIH